MGRTWTGAVAGALAAMALFALAWLADITWMRIVFGLPLLLLLPGGLAAWALFPAQRSDGQGLRWLERVVLSVAFSVVLVPLLGLGLEAAGAFREAVFVAWLEGLCLVLLGVAVARSGRLPAAERWPPEWTSPVAASSIALGLLALAAAAAMVVFMVDPVADDEEFTEVALFGATGGRTCYPASYDGEQYLATQRTPDNRTVPEEGCPLPSDQVTLAVINHEGRAVAYTLSIWWARGDGRQPTAVDEFETRTINLADGESFLQTFTLTAPPGAGDHFLVFQLYEGSAPAITAGQPLPDNEHDVRLAIDA